MIVMITAPANERPTISRGRLARSSAAPRTGPKNRAIQIRCPRKRAQTTWVRG